MTSAAREGAPDSRAAFQVDLHGVVDLLARHLYSSPRVYLRELLQNGVDALTARGLLPEAQRGAGGILVTPCADGSLEVRDDGVGLTPTEAVELLATIGRSSKRDEDLGAGREEFLGQFGIGLLSAFMVAETIELVSRSARDTGAPPVRWLGHADGRYELAEIAHDDPDVPADGGSLVRLHPRRDMEHWLAAETVMALAEDVGGLLPVPVIVTTTLEDGTSVGRRVSAPALPWATGTAPAVERDRRLTAYAERTLGFTPLARIDLDIPLAGLTGVAYVLPAALAPTSTAHHRVYLRRMLLSTATADLLPPWAFFVRCVVDVAALRPTASREGLYDDEVLVATRDALGRQVRAWLLATLAERSPLATAFLRTHHLAVRALALQDDEMLELAAQVLPFESTLGTTTLADAADRLAGERLLFTTDLEEFRRLAPVAAAQDLLLVNGGYVYDDELLARVAARFPAWRVSRVAADDVAHTLEEVEPLRELEVTDALAAASTALGSADCDVVLRRFEPTTLPALLLRDTEGDHARAAAATAAAADDLWGGIVAGLAKPARPRRLVLNDDNATVRALLAGDAGPVQDAGVHALYVTSLLASGRPLHDGEARLLDGALRTLLDGAFAPPSSTDPSAPPHEGDPR
ncbi:HSP90 family protein [Sanguibacter sp. HDW7]|uniref:HSP90 family protein n=1 Tax=Sanguibacter sp. HDW7 TaxID=2714931 RepID=UPI00140A045C|nr:HSP90 family protein [Sanguibacter sp. HDW7]QIK83286.1 HSP90 family protein [Sanguibacter sp. HDW7]